MNSAKVRLYNRMKGVAALVILLVMGIFIPVTVALLDASEKFVASLKHQYASCFEAIKVAFYFIKKGE